ncbi:hypothetical protein BK025_07230 [Sodalis sp. TME1]|nr:hypothetical protein BK025_07230 [Sodalis sp. TME1]
MGQRLMQLAVYLPILLGAGIRRRQQRVDALFNRVKRRRRHPPCGQAGGFRLQRAPHVQRFDKFADRELSLTTSVLPPLRPIKPSFSNLFSASRTGVREIVSISASRRS